MKKIITGIVGVALIGGVAACQPATSKKDDSGKVSPTKTASKSATKQDSSSEGDAVQNITISSCLVDPDTHWGNATLKIHNPTSKASSYIITIAFDSKDGKTQFGTALASVDSVAPGQTAITQAQGLDTITGVPTCRVASATRMAS